MYLRLRCTFVLYRISLHLTLNRTPTFLQLTNTRLFLHCIVAYDGPPVRHPSFTVPSQTRRHSDRPGYLASPAGSPMLAGAATATPTFRLQKEQRPSWNYRLSANGRVYW